MIPESQRSLCPDHLLVVPRAVIVVSWGHFQLQPFHNGIYYSWERSGDGWNTLVLRSSACLSHLFHPALLSQSPPFSMCSSSRNMESGSLHLWVQLFPVSLPPSSISCVALLSFAYPAEKPWVNSQKLLVWSQPQRRAALACFGFCTPAGIWHQDTKGVLRNTMKALCWHSLK